MDRKVGIFLKVSFKNILILFTFIFYVFFPAVVHSRENNLNIETVKNSFFPPKYNYSGKKSIINWAENSTHAFIVEVKYSKDNRYRYCFLAPKHISGKTIINDGVWEITYEPARKHIMKKKLKNQDHEEIINIFNTLCKNYNFKFINTAKLIGRVCYPVQFISKRDNQIYREIYIDREKNLILQDKWYENGKLVIESHFIEIEFPDNFPENTFTINPAEYVTGSKEKYNIFDEPLSDINRIKEIVNFKPVIPPDMPSGFIFENANIIKYKNSKILHLKYTDGLNTVSLFESNMAFELPYSMKINRKSDMDFPSVPCPGINQVYHSKVYNTNFIIMGNINKKSLNEMGDFIKTNKQKGELYR